MFINAISGEVGHENESVWLTPTSRVLAHTFVHSSFRISVCSLKEFSSKV